MVTFSSQLSISHRHSMHDRRRLVQIADKIIRHFNWARVRAKGYERDTHLNNITPFMSGYPAHLPGPFTALQGAVLTSK